VRSQEDTSFPHRSHYLFAAVQPQKREGKGSACLYQRARGASSGGKFDLLSMCSSASSSRLSRVRQPYSFFPLSDCFFPVPQGGEGSKPVCQIFPPTLQSPPENRSLAAIPCSIPQTTRSVIGRRGAYRENSPSWQMTWCPSIGKSLT